MTPDDATFWFRMGRMVDNLPEALTEWRMTTGDPQVAQAVSRLMGGVPASWETGKKDYIEVLTSSDSVQVVIDSPQAVRSEFILWARSGPLHQCDGFNFLSPDENVGKPCGCPPLMVDRKRNARASRGPTPNTSVTFRLAEGSDLGVGCFQTSSWLFLDTLSEFKDELARINGAARCELSLERVDFETKKGRRLFYMKPTIKLLGAFADAHLTKPSA